MVKKYENSLCLHHVENGEQSGKLQWLGGRVFKNEWFCLPKTVRVHSNPIISQLFGWLSPWNPLKPYGTPWSSSPVSLQETSATLGDFPGPRRWTRAPTTPVPPSAAPRPPRQTRRRRAAGRAETGPGDRGRCLGSTNLTKWVDLDVPKSGWEVKENHLDTQPTQWEDNLYVLDTAFKKYPLVQFQHHMIKKYFLKNVETIRTIY